MCVCLCVGGIGSYRANQVTNEHTSVIAGKNSQNSNVGYSFYLTYK